MKKENIVIEVDHDINLSGYVNIDELINELIKLKELKAEYLIINTHDDDGVLYTTTSAYFNREETDEEFNERVELEKKQEEYKILREIDLYQKLKLKYELNSNEYIKIIDPYIEDCDDENSKLIDQRFSEVYVKKSELKVKI